MRELERLEAFHRLAKSPEYLNHLKPFLTTKLHNSWLNPAQSESVEQFHKQYSEVYGQAKAAEELMRELEDAGAKIQSIRKSLNKDEKNKKYEL